jgi:hypothetical protein
MNHAKKSFNTEIFTGAIMNVVENIFSAATVLDGPRRAVTCLPYPVDNVTRYGPRTAKDQKVVETLTRIT